ncbi:MAG: hypothetical protein ACOY5W_01620 [Pseudomonadota bacterium]
MKSMKQLSVVVPLFLAGCATTGAGVESGTAGVQPDGVACASATDCAEKWQRAEAWLRKHADWPIRTRTEQVIETERPRSRWYSRTHYRVTRTPSDGGAVIRIQASCQPSVYCAPDPEAVRTAFYRYLATGEDRDARH